VAIAIDKSVLLDLLLCDPRFGPASEAAMKRHFPTGLIIGEAVLAEIIPALDGQAVEKMLQNWGIEFVPSSLESASLAGGMYQRFLERGGKRGRVLPDFLIGAHAQVQAEGLLARDFGYYRDYFTGLNVIDPSKR
jgi:predicted nucleic acid-binding protein